MPIGLPVFHASWSSPTHRRTGSGDHSDVVVAALLVFPATLVFTTLASLLPARRAAEIKPAEALRYE